MARIKLGAILQDIRGQLGDQAVYGAWKSNVHWIRQAATSVHNPNSAKQGVVRQLLSQYTKQWGVLSTAQQGAWNAYATNGYGGGAGTGEGSALDIIKRNTGTYTGINAYLMTNAKLVEAGLAPTNTAPVGLTPPSQPQTLACAVWPTVTWVAPTVVKAGAKVLVWIAPKNGKEFHPQFTVSALATALTATITTIKGPDGLDVFAILPAGFKVLLQAYTLDTDGTFSAPSNIAEGTVAPP